MKKKTKKKTKMLAGRITKQGRKRLPVIKLKQVATFAFSPLILKRLKQSI